MSNDEESGTALQSAALSAVEMISDITLPAPVRRNALRAFDQLCASLVDIPVAYLEGVAQLRRAENQARAELVQESGRQIAAGIDVDPAYARAAATKFAQKIVRERQALDNMSAIAAKQLSSDSISDGVNNQDQEIDPDWINSFEQEASQKSSEEVQELFGKILAGEISCPGTFSIKAVKLLGQMDRRTAMMFQKLCSICIAVDVVDRNIDSRVAVLEGTAGDNGILKYGLDFTALSKLQEYGLIIADLNSWSDYSFCIVKDGVAQLGFTYANQNYVLVPKEGMNPPIPFKISGVMLSSAGKELRRVVPIVEDATYSKDLVTYFDAKGFSLARVRDPAT